MSSNLKVNSIIPSTGGDVGLGTAGGTITPRCPIVGITTFSGAVSITDTTNATSVTITQDPLGFPDDSAQPQATILVKHGTSGSNRRWVGIGASLTGAWIQSSSPGGTGLAAPLWINKGGGDVAMGSGGTRLFVRHSGVQGIGIGINAPVAPLHIYAAANDNLLFGGNINASDGGAIRSMNSDASAWKAFELLSAEMRIGGTNSLRLSTGGTGGSIERLRITSAGLVGIGTVTPQRNLHIHQPTAANSYLHMTNSTTGATTTDGFSLYVATDGQTYYRARESTGTHVFYTGTTERLRIKSDGRVSIASSLAVAGVCTAATFVPTEGQLSNRNLMINGSMQVAQRGTSTTTTGDYACDRYRHTFAGTDEAPTMAQHALTSSDTGPWAAGFRYSTHITNGNQTSGAGTGDTVFMKYKVEAQDLAQSGWDYTSTSSYITFSFWVKASVAQNYYGYLLTEDGTNQTYPFETGALSANTWTKITKTIPGNSGITINNDNGTGLAIHLAAFVGTDQTSSGVALNTWATFATGTRMPDNTSTWYTTNDATFEFTGVQLEVGSVATPFEHRSFGDELARCQRYYQRWGGSGTTGNYTLAGAYVYNNGNNTATGLNLSVPLRATPSIENLTSGGHLYSQGNGSTITGTVYIGYTVLSNWLALGLSNTSDLGDANYACAFTNRHNQHIALNSEL